MIPFDAIILAAGYGRRLRPITLHTPKPLVRYRGKPLILHAIESLIPVGVSRFLINAFWLSDRLKEFLEGTFGMDIVLSRERILLGTGGGVRQFNDIVSPLFIVHNSDIFHRINLSIPVKKLMDTEAIGIMVLVDGPVNNVVVKGNRVVDFGTGGGFTYTGISAFRREFMGYLPERGSLIEGIINAIRNNETILAYITAEPWMDLGKSELFSSDNNL